MLLLACVGALSGGCRELPRQPEVPPSLELPIVPKQLASPNVEELEPEEPAQTNLKSQTYHRLTAEQCNTLACEHSDVALIVELTAASDPPPLLNLGTSADADRLRKVIAAHLSRQARLETSAVALNLYYRLLEAELLSDVLQRTQTEVDRLVRAIDVAKDAGVSEGDVGLQLRKKQVELRIERSRLQSGIDQLNIELKPLLALSTTPGRLLPVDEILVTSEALDETTAVQLGLARRPDLWLIRDMIGGLNAGTVSEIQQAIAELVPPLKAITTTTQVMVPGLRSVILAFQQGEVEGTRRQLNALLRQREEMAAKSIQAAIQEWKGQREIVALTKNRLEGAKQRVQELEVKRRAGLDVESAYRQATLDQYAIEVDLIREAVKWKQADVTIRQAMALLCDGEPNSSCHSDGTRSSDRTCR